MGDYVIDDSADLIVFSHAGLELSSAVSPVYLLFYGVLLFYFIYYFIYLFIFNFLFYFTLESDRKATVTTPILTSSPL